MNFIKDPLLGEYFIQIDDYNYSAFKTIMPDSGKPYDSCIGHFSSLGKALTRIADHMVKQKSYNSIKDYIIELENIKNEFKQHFL
jgi:hypothetical protein|tara:strand:- start:64 stop:318 length:255 start_codon:yes stop_codon:yes gene_type:complete